MVRDFKRIVISGGPGAGKTLLLEELQRRGYSCSAEVARRIIQEQVRLGGSALPWNDREAYSRLMLAGSITSWEVDAVPDQVTFFDRGIPDTLCYVRLTGLSREVEQEAEAMCQRYRYGDSVFLVPPWREIYKTDAERRQGFDEAIRTYESMKSTYQNCGYEVVDIPCAPVVDRAEFVLAAISKE